MIYKISDSGIFFPLLEAVNTVKAGTNTILTIKYFYDEDSLRSISSRTLSLEHFKVDIENSLFQWEDFISNLYSNKVHFKGNLTVKFELSSEESADLIFKCSYSGPKIKVDTKNIIFNSTASWGSSLIPNVDDVLRYAVYGVGQFLGLSNQLGDTPMSSITLNKSFHLSNGLSPDRNGLITEPVLHKYKLLTPHFKKIFGSTATSVARVYGCTDSNASNYNPLANTNDGSCINIDNTVVSNSSSRYIPPTASISQYFIVLNSDAGYYTYSGEGIVPHESTYTVNFNEIYQIPKFSSVLSLDGNILSTTFTTEGTNAFANQRKVSHFDRLNQLLFGQNNTNKAFDNPDRPFLTQVMFLSSGEAILLENSLTGASSTGYTIQLNSTPSGYELIDCENDYDFGQNIGTEGNYNVARGSVQVAVNATEDDYIIANFFDFADVDNFIANIYISGDAPIMSNIFASDSFVSVSLPFFDNPTLTDVHKIRPRALTIQISPFQDSYIVSSGVISDDSTKTHIWTGTEDRQFVQEIFDCNGCVNSIIYPMATSGNFSFTSGTSTASMGLINLSSKKWLGSTQSFAGTSDFDVDIQHFQTFTTTTTASQSENSIISDAVAASDTLFIGHIYEDDPSANTLVINPKYENGFGGSERISRLGGRYKLVISRRLREGAASSDHATLSIEDLSTQNESPYINRPDNGFGYKNAILMVEYGWLLFGVDNLSGRLSGFDATQELHIPAGDNSLLEYNDPEFVEGGYRMIDITISPMDNFVYAIVEHPENADRHIVVYKLLSDGFQNVDYILENARSIPNPFDGELSSVQIGEDGNMYFYSKGSSDYIMVPSPDIQWSVDVLLYTPTVFLHSLDTTIDYLPNRRVLDLLKHDGQGNYVHPNNLDAWNNALWNDSSIGYQLNVAGSIPHGLNLPLGDQERFIVGNLAAPGDIIKLHIDINNIAEFVETDNLSNADIINTDNLSYPTEGASHERLVSLQGNILARVSLAPAGLIITYKDSSDEIQAKIINEVSELISVESYVSADEDIFFYNIIYVKTRNTDRPGIYKTKILYDGTETTFDEDQNTIVEDLLFEVVEGGAYIDSCIVNSGEANTTLLYIAIESAGQISFSLLQINGDDFSISSTIGAVAENDLLLYTTSNISSSILANINYDYANSTLKFINDSGDTVSDGKLILNIHISYLGNLIDLRPFGIEIGETILQYSITSTAHSVLKVESSNDNYVSENPLRIISLEPALSRNRFVLLGNDTGATALKYFTADSSSLEEVTILPTNILENYSDDFQQDSNGDYLYDASQDIRGIATNLISLPNGRIYIETTSGEISRIYGPSSTSPYYAIGIGDDGNVPNTSGFGPISYNVKGEIGGMPQQGPEPDGPVTEAIPGCMNPNACNYDPNATVNDGSCALPDEDLVSLCGGGCDGAIPYTGITNCDTCYTGEPDEDTDCYVCPAGTDLGNGTIATGCEGIEGPCFPDDSACEIFGCFESEVDFGTVCNGVESAGLDQGSDLYPDTHLSSECFFATQACQCDGVDSLTPNEDPTVIGEGQINCTDCDNDPYTSNYLDGTYCDCEMWARHNNFDAEGNNGLNPADKIHLQNNHEVCDCEGAPILEGCNCFKNVIDSAYCDCGVLADNVGAPFCDCDENSTLTPGKECYDENGELNCAEQKLLHYYDGDGDGLYNADIFEFKCPSEALGFGNGPGGYPLWTTSGDALGVDGCDGYEDDCNCIPLNEDGTYNFNGLSEDYQTYQELQESHPCGGCYFPSAPDQYADSECDCGDIPEGYCDCGGTVVMNACDELFGCNGEENRPGPFIVGTGEGAICSECQVDANGDPLVYDFCMNCPSLGATQDASTGIITYTNGDQKCNCDSELLEYGQCCAGVSEWDDCLNTCVPIGTTSTRDCADRCPSDPNYQGVDAGAGGNGIDACGFCDGTYAEIPSSTVEGEDCGCPDTIDGTPPTADCNGNCDGTAVADLCGVCDGDNSECTGCTDAEAYNYDNTATIGCEDCCQYYEITNPNTYPLIDEYGDEATNMDSVITHHSDVEIEHFGIPISPSSPTIVTEYQLGVDGNTTNVTRDNPIFTNKCQVISASNPILILERAIDNAEITYSYTPTLGSVDPITGVIDQDPESISSNTVATASGKTVNFYFRLEGDLNTAANTNANNFFGSYMSSNIQSVSKEDGDATVLESGTVEGTPEIQATINNVNFAAISATYDNYHVYKVTMMLDSDGTIAEIPEGIDFSPLFAPLEGATNTNVYVHEDCPEGNTHIGAAVSISEQGLSDVQIADILANGFTVVISEEATTTTPAVTVTYTLYNGFCQDDCTADGNDYAQVCGNPAANNYTPELGECQEYGDDTFCVFPEEPSPYCSDPNYLEFHEADTSEGEWEADDSLCLTLLEMEETETQTTQGTYTITTDYTGDSLPDVEYIIYTKAGKIIQDESEVRNVITSSGSKRTIQTIRSVGDCAGFVPIAFNTNGEWLKGKFTISKNDTVLWQLDYGSLDTQTFGSSIIPDGSAILKLGATDCTAGCDATTISVTGCTRSVEKDVKEFTDFTVEILTEESPTDSYDETSFILYNITTGEKLIELTEGIGNGEVREETFKLSDTTVLGVKAISKNMLIYRIIDEQGKILKTKSLYNDSYFEPFTLELLEPGCTDSEAANYNENAGIDNGTCIDAALYDCVKDALLNIDTLQCDSRESTKALQMYTVYQSYKESLKEKNSVKIEMYKEKLADLCNCKTC